jgi:hypothetical protein
MRVQIAMAAVVFAGTLLMSAGVARSFESPATPSPTPYPLASAPPMLADPRYFYIAALNDPKKHPVPMEVQTGPTRDIHMQCLDWSRARKPTAKFEYFLTTCECWRSSDLPFHPSPSP